MLDDGERDSRSALMAAAYDLFAERGFEGASTQAIVERSGTSKGSFYHHFGSKEDLYASVLEATVQRMWAVSFAAPEDQPVDRESYWRYITRAWRQSTTYMIAHPHDLKLWRDFQERWRFLGDAGPTRRLRAKMLEMSESLADLGQRLGCVRTDLSPRQCAELVEALDGVLDAWFFDAADTQGARAALQQQGSMSLELIWRVLAPVDEFYSDGVTVATRHLAEIATAEEVEP